LTAVEAAVSGEMTKVVRIRITETRRGPYSSGQPADQPKSRRFLPASLVRDGKCSQRSMWIASRFIAFSRELILFFCVDPLGEGQWPPRRLRAIEGHGDAYDDL